MSDKMKELMTTIANRRGFLAKLGVRSMAVAGAVFGLSKTAQATDEHGCDLCFPPGIPCESGECWNQNYWCWPGSGNCTCCECYGEVVADGSCNGVWLSCYYCP
jgi:hypothetical protein